MLLMTIFLGACASLAGEPEIVATMPAVEQLQMATNPPDVANGARIFQENCVRCHGINGAGDGELVQTGEVPRMVSFLEASAVHQQSLEFYYNTISNGNIINLMPPWNKSLSIQERWDVAMYVYTLHYTSEQIERGSQLVTDVSGELSLESDAALAASSGLEGDDAFAAVAYQRVRSLENWGVAAEVTQEAPKDFDTISFMGTVTHGTAGYPVPQGQIVQLRYGNAEDGLQVLETALDANNHYQFEGIAYHPEYEYFVIAVYQERGFVGQLLKASDIQEVNQEDIVLYETTDEPGVVVLQAVDFVVEYLDVEGLGTGLVITQQNIYENTSDRMFHITPPEGNLSVSLLLQLPIGAMILNNSNDPRFLQAQNEYAIVDLRPVYPGLHHMDAVYFIPYENGRTIDIPVNNRFEGDVSIVVTVSELNILSDVYQLADEEINLGTEENPIMARRYIGTANLNIGESILFDIGGEIFPNKSSGLSTTVVTQEQLLPLLLIIIVIVAVIGVGILIGLRTRSNNPQYKIEQLLHEISELEALHEAGRINHDLFQQKRKALRDQLAQLMSENEES